MALTVLKSAPLDLHLAEQEGADDFSPADAAVSVEPEAAPVTNGADPDTLSNEYIDSVIVDRQGQLQRCWLSRLKDAPGLKGQITLQFEISRRGRVKDLRVVDASIKDEVLQKCVMSVFERLTFREFKGSEISLSYPINFE